MNKQNRLIGIFYVIFGASFWGVGGTVAQHLFQSGNIDVDWFVTTRLLIGGILLLSSQLVSSNRKHLFQIWREPTSRNRLITFSLFGMLLVQYSYMVSIALGNAAIATLLQYLAPIFIIFYFIVKGIQKLTGSDLLAISLTLLGTFLLLTNGSFNNLSVPLSAVIWGVISGLSLAFYTLYARSLLESFSSVIVVGWAMLLAGIIMNFVHPIWAIEATNWSASIYIALGFTILFGTALAFWMFIKSLEYLTAKETTLLGTVEPLTAVVSSILWLQLPFGFLQIVGGLLILILVVYLSLQNKEK
ncbi:MULTISPECIES: DMT family transporter [unclassified Peribacillus]|uniref:DMT family transporter n=1 Tax=unclassified Peribacillus TaxID=2675266 RepID=UPI0019123B37|nr:MULTISPECIES: DMT family transporter [unclassified Peribacillus]MBK5441638.1 EamA family transporter [Peribacillus sp. TH24]MBK5501843.1 EamA family transporter [Peribacillus sp. TH14]WMX53230.1 DMT family transporter [Peribacillus sp. R9-11]